MSDIFSIVSTALTALSLLVTAYKFMVDKDIRERISHRRNRFYFVALFLLAFCFPLFILYTVHNRFIIVFSLFYICYMICCFRGLYPVHRVAHPLLRFYKKRMDKGFTFENMAYFEPKLRLLYLDANEKIEYLLLRATHLVANSRLAEAYDTLCSIKKSQLYPSEVIYVNIRKAMVLSEMGCMDTALSLIGPHAECKSVDPFVWVTYAYIHENRGDLDTAFACAKKAKDVLAQGNCDYVKNAAVYSDFANFAEIAGNSEEQLYYLRQAYENAKVGRHSFCIYTAAARLVDALGLRGNRDEAIVILDEMEQLDIAATMENLLLLNNLRIEHFRQAGDAHAVYELIRDGYFVFADKLNPVQKQVHKSSTFRMIMNGLYKHDWFDNEIDTDFAVYMELPVVERISVMMEYYRILIQYEFKVVAYGEPYRTLKKHIANYFSTDAVTHIDARLECVPPVQIKVRARLMNLKLSIQAYTQGSDHVSKSKQLYLDLYDMLMREGLQFHAADVLMTFIDQCFSTANIVVPHSLNATYTSLEEALVPILTPLPQEESDGIRLKYQELLVPEEMPMTYVQAHEATEPLQTLVALYDNWQAHPQKREYAVGIAHTLLLLGRVEESRPYYEYYKNCKVSWARNAAWFNRYVAHLEKTLS